MSIQTLLAASIIHNSLIHKHFFYLLCTVSLAQNSSCCVWWNENAINFKCWAIGMNRKLQYTQYFNYYVLDLCTGIRWVESYKLLMCQKRKYRPIRSRCKMIDWLRWSLKNGFRLKMKKLCLSCSFVVIKIVDFNGIWWTIDCFTKMNADYLTKTILFVFSATKSRYGNFN